MSRKSGSRKRDWRQIGELKQEKGNGLRDDERQIREMGSRNGFERQVRESAIGDGLRDDERRIREMN